MSQSTRQTLGYKVNDNYHDYLARNNSTVNRHTSVGGRVSKRDPNVFVENRRSSRISDLSNRRMSAFMQPGSKSYYNSDESFNFSHENDPDFHKIKLMKHGPFFKRMYNNFLYFMQTVGSSQHFEWFMIVVTLLNTILMFIETFRWLGHENGFDGYRYLLKPIAGDYLECPCSRQHILFVLNTSFLFFYILEYFIMSVGLGKSYINSVSGWFDLTLVLIGVLEFISDFYTEEDCSDFYLYKYHTQPQKSLTELDAISQNDGQVNTNSLTAITSALANARAAKTLKIFKCFKALRAFKFLKSFRIFNTLMMAIIEIFQNHMLGVIFIMAVMIMLLCGVWCHTLRMSEGNFVRWEKFSDVFGHMIVCFTDFGGFWSQVLGQNLEFFGNFGLFENFPLPA